ncbi:MAG: UDP-N-acetylmuramoyl-tripeptide--D-alanyl-D-alanine ligase [Acidobacteria bacterium]|nr:UDP-N-acetylmuramoyl-tripeptide--D-alanyl-D-alanine ligase [Acidobacteriota bacterium]
MKGVVANQPQWRLTAEEIAGALDGALVAGQGAEPLGPVSIDTRTLDEGDLFFAVRGERFDGHDFVDRAVERGARGVVVSDRARIPAVTPDRTVVLVVHDTVNALQALARHVRRASGARVVAITGSAGKTSTKEIVAALLAAQFRVVRNRGNLNNHIGLPLSLMALLERPDVAVMELGMNHAGEIARLVSVAEPDVRMWINVGDAHLGFFGTVDQVADAKAEIMHGATSDGVLIANADDARVMARARRFPGRIVTFGIRQPADVRATEVRDRGLDGTAATLSTSHGPAALRVPLIGQAQLANVLAAVAVALEFQIPLETVRALAASLVPVAHRGEVVRLRDNIVVVDDSYNSSPSALAAALELLRTERHCRRRVAVLGEMLELGPRSRALHRECGRLAAGCGVDLLISVGGENAQGLCDGAVEAGLDSGAAWHVETSAEAGPVVASRLEGGDLVLVKGSRGVETDRVVEHLRSELA